MTHAGGGKLRDGIGTGRLCVGTAQFGLDYGISNPVGRVPLYEIERILARAREIGVDMLDTAEQYGEAERALGQVGAEECEIVGKIGALHSPPEHVAEELTQRVEASLGRLRRSRLHGLLLHRPQQLFDGDEMQAAILEALEGAKRAGLVARVGFSSYNPQETESLAALRFWDLAQLPISPIDGRWSSGRALATLRAGGTEIHVLSVFLQGLLLMPSSERPAGFKPWAPFLDQWQEWVRARGLSLVQGALQLALRMSEAERLVVGVTSVLEFDEIVAALSNFPETLPPGPVTVDDTLLNPSLWNRTP